MASVLAPPRERTSVPPPPPAATPAAPAERPVVLHSDRFAFAVWLSCAALMAALLVKDLLAAIVGRGG